MASFMTSVGGGLGPREEAEEEAEELTRVPRELQSTQELEEAVQVKMHKVQAWYRQLQQTKISEMQSLVLAGKPQEALDNLREANLLQPGFPPSPPPFPTAIGLFVSPCVYA
jgi:hypothetical protein